MVANRDSGDTPLPDSSSKALKTEFPDLMRALAALVTSTVSLGLPRASNLLFVVGQLLAYASHDRAFAALVAEACMTGAPGRGATAGGEASADLTAFGGFASFLEANAVSVSSPDEVKSDLIYVAWELVECFLVARTGTGPGTTLVSPLHKPRCGGNNVKLFAVDAPWCQTARVAFAARLLSTRLKLPGSSSRLDRL